MDNSQLSNGFSEPEPEPDFSDPPGFVDDVSDAGEVLINENILTRFSRRIAWRFTQHGTKRNGWIRKRHRS